MHADPILIVSFTTPNRYQWVAVSQFMNNVMSHPLSAPLTQQCFEVCLMGSLMNTCIDNGFTGRLGRSHDKLICGCLSSYMYFDCSWPTN